jgi:hypothetical protein
MTAALLIIILLLPASAFVRRGVRLYQMAGDSIWDAANAAKQPSPLLLVNLPMRITPRERLYPLGFEGVTPLPMRVSADDLVYVHTGRRGAARAIAFGVVANEAPPGYTYQLFGPQGGWEEIIAAVRRGETVYLTRYESDRIHLVEAGAAAPSIPSEPLASFGERIALMAAGATCDPAGQVRLTAHWQVTAAVETDATVFAHLLDADGALVTQAAGSPLRQMLPFWLLWPGETVRDVRDFAPVLPGAYTIRLGVWDLATGAQWPAGPPADVLLPVLCP